MENGFCHDQTKRTCYCEHRQAVEILRRSPVLEIGKGLIAMDARKDDRLLMISALETRMLAVPVVRYASIFTIEPGSPL